jgi:UDP-glucose 4-epimerase
VETTVTELFDHLNVLTDAGANRVFGPGKPGEQQRSVLSYDRARTVLGWSPEVTLREGLTRTVGWFRHRLETVSA